MKNVLISGYVTVLFIKHFKIVQKLNSISLIHSLNKVGDIIILSSLNLVIF